MSPQSPTGFDGFVASVNAYGFLTGEPVCRTSNHQDERPIGTSPDAYGHFGFGGSLGFADPANDLAFAYLINRPGDRWQNPRTLRLLGALRSLL